MKKYTLSNLTILISAILLLACGGSGKQNTDENDAAYNQADAALKNQIKDVVHNVPSPTEIPYLLQATGAEYNAGLIADDEKVDQYMLQPDKAALSLGAYAADIGYLSSYDKTQEAIDYLNACKKLVNNLGIAGSFEVEDLKRFEANIGNKDTLATLLDEAIKKTDKYLRDDSRNELSALIVTGSFIEGLSISTEVVRTFPKDLLADEQRNLVLAPIVNIILGQSESVGEIIKMLNSVDTSETTQGILTDLNELQKSYESVNLEEQIKNNQLTDVLSDKHLTSITEIVKRLKDSMTE